MSINRFRFQKVEDPTRVNARIRAPQVRLVDNEGTMLGVVPIAEAIAKAVEAGYDLVEIAPNAAPPVCKIMDYGKFKYEKSKREKEGKKKQHVMHLKEIKFHPKTEAHDYNFKMQHARNFLLKGDRVKLTMVFRGREITYLEFGKKFLDRADEELADIAQNEIKYKMEGRNMISVYVPDKVKVQAYKRKQEKEKKPAEPEVS